MNGRRAGGWGRRKPSMPGRVGGPKPRRRSRIGAKAQQHEGRQSPTRPFLRLACGPHGAPQPTHRRTCVSTCIITRTRDNRNRNLPGDMPPPFPAMELREIVGAHQPDEAMLGIQARQFGERIGGVAGLEPLLDRGDPDRRMPRHHPRRCHARPKRRHPRLVLQRIAGRDEPPHLVEPERPQRMERQPPMPAMRRIERAAEKTDAFHCRATRSRAPCSTRRIRIWSASIR